MHTPIRQRSVNRADLSLNNVLDVTLRDGGYLNKWRFTDEELTAVLRFLNGNGVNRAEIGFLQAAGDTTSVVNGCPVSFLQRTAQEHPDMQLVAMLNPAVSGWREAVDGKVPYLSLIRMTCTGDLVEQALEIAEYLHNIYGGIEVSLNLICISSYSLEEVAVLLKKIARSNRVDRVYFADSRGALYPYEIEPLISLAKRHCRQSLGFHAHDTLGNAIENSKQAYACGCDLIDVSLNGFGLAGGNTSFAGFLADNALAEPSIQAQTQAFCESHLPLKHAASNDRDLFAVLARKNIDPIWSEALLGRYSTKLYQLTERLPRRIYKTLDDVLEMLESNDATLTAAPTYTEKALDGTTFKMDSKRS